MLSGMKDAGVIMDGGRRGRGNQRWRTRGPG